MWRLTLVSVFEIRYFEPMKLPSTFYPFIVFLVCALRTISANANEAGTCQLDELLDCDLELPAKPNKHGWQLGIGVATIHNVPVYIGAKESRTATFPIPYITYNSPKLKIGQGGIVGRLFDSDKWLLSVSLSGAIPVNSEDTVVRKGMADIDAIFEFGPSLKYYFLGNDKAPDAGFLDLNIRKSYTLGLRSLKLASSPGVVVRTRLADLYWGGNINLRGRLGVEFVSSDYASEFYGVSAEDVTATRSEYTAAGGYGGVRASGSVRWQKNRHIVSSFIALADIGGANYVDSPLIKKTRHVYGGMVYFYLFE